MEKRVNRTLFCVAAALACALALSLALAACPSTAGNSTKGPVEITAASVGGLAAPEFGEAPVALDALSAGDSTYTVQSLSWIPEPGEAFEGNKDYIANIVLKAAVEHTFAGSITPTVNAGTAAAGTITGSEAENTLSFSVSFAKTGESFGRFWKTSNVTTGTFYSVRFGGGTWVALPEDGGIKYSTDGVTWNNTNVITNEYFAVYYDGSGKWVAVGNESASYILYSTDGITWHESGTSGRFRSVYYANGVWVAGAYGSGTKGIKYSSDGETWIDASGSGVNFDQGYYVLSYAGNYWIAGGSDNNGLWYSVDGMSWTQSTITSGAFYSLSHANGKWVAGSSGNGLYYSTDNGATWTASDITSGSWWLLATNGSIWVAGNNNGNLGIRYSENGQTWQNTSVTTGQYSVYYANGIWVAGGAADTSPYPTGNGIKYSTDGITWTNSNITSGLFYSFVFANNTLVAAPSSLGTGSNLGLLYSK
ncbi:MAG: hypothetical protein LBE10_06845 [Treponema sp.]|jgi:hypothetical protein|nr:hypothetical protein [Treponema sp.]